MRNNGEQVTFMMAVTVFGGCASRDTMEPGDIALGLVYVHASVTLSPYDIALGLVYVHASVTLSSYHPITMPL